MPPRLPARPYHQAVDGVPWKNSKQQLQRPSAINSLIITFRSQFTTSPEPQASQRQQREYGDPYALAQARQRKAANLARQAVLKKERAASIGDPVRGITTPFIHSFDTCIPPPSSTVPPTISADSPGRESASPPPIGQQNPLNFFLSQSEVLPALEEIRNVTKPLPADKLASDPEKEREALEKHQRDHVNAVEAISRIINLENGSSKDHTRVNIQRCIETFGRHRTDETLPPKPTIALNTSGVEKTPRAGPDTGSSEVQVAILTAKIRVLVNHLETGRQDKVNKRNLRLLVHRRQKLLRYLRQKERGGPRWRHLIETLGLTEGTWKGEISM